MLELVKQASQGQAVMQRGQRTGLRKCRRNQGWAGRKQDQGPEPGIKVWSMILRQTANSQEAACTDSCLMSPVIKQMHWIWSLFSVTSVSIDQWPGEPRSSWAASSLHAFIFDTGFSVAGSAVPLVPVVLYCLLSLQFFIRWAVRLFTRNLHSDKPGCLDWGELEGYSSLAY